jgi:large subunit ribosomal protein L22
MGNRKRNSSIISKNLKSSSNISSLKKCPLSPRKTRLVADTVRGLQVDKALSILQFTPNVAARYIEKLLLNAISCYQEKNGDIDAKDSIVVIKSIHVDSAVMLKRLRTAPQGRGHRIRKRSNHITIELEQFSTQKN